MFVKVIKLNVLNPPSRNKIANSICSLLYFEGYFKRQKSYQNP
jgi:hypothetical protein